MSLYSRGCCGGMVLDYLRLRLIRRGGIRVYAQAKMKKMINLQKTFKKTKKHR